MSWFQTLKIAVISYLNGAVAKAALESFFKMLIKKVFKGATFGGIKGWLLRLFIKEIIIERGAEPAVKKVFRELGYGSRIIKGHILYNKLEDAENENNQSDYDDIVNDIMS